MNVPIYQLPDYYLCIVVPGHKSSPPPFACSIYINDVVFAGDSTGDVIMCGTRLMSLYRRAVSVQNTRRSFQAVLMCSFGVGFRGATFSECEGVNLHPTRMLFIHFTRVVDEIIRQ